MRILINLLGVLAAVVTFFVTLTVLAAWIPGEGWGRVILIVTALVRILLALLIALVVFRKIVNRKRVPPVNPDQP